MSREQALILMFLSSGLLLMALSVPLIREQVPRNPWYGFRVEKTLASDEAWYPANRYDGECLLVCGAVIAAGSAVLWALAPGLPADAVGWIGGVFTLGPLTVAVAASFLYLTRLE
jgi:hypothetical protein